MSSAGNAAGTGARIALLDKASRRTIEELVRRVEKIETAIEPKFQAHFVEAMGIPHSTAPYAHLRQVVPLPAAEAGRAACAPAAGAALVRERHAAPRSQPATDCNPKLSIVRSAIGVQSPQRSTPQPVCSRPQTPRQAAFRWSSRPTSRVATCRRTLRDPLPSVVTVGFAVMRMRDSAIAQMPDRSTAHRVHLIPEPAPFEGSSMRLRLAEEGCRLYRTRVT